MAHFRKVLLVQLPTPDKTIRIVPIDPIACCNIIILDEKTGLWVYKQTVPNGGMEALNDRIDVDEFTEQHRETILANGGICYVKVDHTNKLEVAKNALGYKKIVLFFTPDLCIA